MLFLAKDFLCRAAKPLPVPGEVKNDADGQEICDIDMNVLVDDLSGAVGEDMEIHEGARHKADDHADSQAKNQIIIFFIVIASQCRLLLREKEYQTRYENKRSDT